MKKRKLVLEEIDITSFEISDKMAELGTVEGNQFSNRPDSCRNTCVNYSCDGATCSVVIC
ncbi:hypothetical protein [Longimicrobium sp.]|uniref:hypothetical protein n=1 Tax=Longimicrobium sp. TaxID=2029185 RepID=UPI002E3625DF|nr:hypothetical protein [Longimicrobium sp.]HEX6037277.1 hypothetical protein [Longimicrobium sp.]